MNAKTRLERFLQNYKQTTKPHIRTSTILGWGANGGYSNDAARNARKLANEGKLRRLSRTEKILIGENTIEGIYEILI